MRTEQEETAASLRSGIAAYAIWGLLPLYFHLIRQASPLEIVANRILWSLLLILGILGLRGTLRDLASGLGRPRIIAALAASAVCIAVNWLVYIYAVSADHVIACSLGYFLNPLVNVLLGVTLLKEKLRGVQLAAVALASSGVAILALAAPDALGIALTLAVSFAFYGFIRKLTPVSAMAGLGIETLVLAAPAALLLFWLHDQATLAFGSDVSISLLLAASSIVTSAPLVLFARAARGLSMVTLGLLQYLAPSLQFLIGIFLLGERMTVANWASFALIWAGLALFVTDAIRRQRQSRLQANSVASNLTGSPTA